MASVSGGLDRKRREDAAERARLRRAEAADLRRQAAALEASAAVLERTWGLRTPEQDAGKWLDTGPLRQYTVDIQ